MARRRETRIERHVRCAPWKSAELWTIEGGRHIPGIIGQTQPMWDWLLGQRR